MSEETSFFGYLPVKMVALPTLVVVMNMIIVVWHNWGHVWHTAVMYIPVSMGVVVVFYSLLVTLTTVLPHWSTC